MKLSSSGKRRGYNVGNYQPRERRTLYLLFLIPALAVFTLAYIAPLAQAFRLSLFEWNGISSEMTFVGFENFIKIFSDQQYFQSFAFTLKFVLLTSVLVNVIGFALALVLCGNFKTRNLLRSMFFMPQIIGTLILGFIWQFIFNNVFPQFGAATGLSLFSVKWLSSAQLSFYALVLVFTWYFSGYIMVIYIAALQGIPGSLLEAAAIDGAGPLKRLVKITLPMIAPSITANIFLALVTTFKMFDLNLALTKGGPFGSTESMGLHIYFEAFNNRHYGYGSAKGLLFFVVIAVLTLIQVRLLKKREVDS